MRLTFCFSRNCRPYPMIFALRSRPCCPGAKFLFSIPQDGLKQRSPFRNNFIPSLRQSLQTGPMYLANVFSYALQPKLFFSLAADTHYAVWASRLGSRALPNLPSAPRQSPNPVRLPVLCIWLPMSGVRPAARDWPRSERLAVHQTVSPFENP